MPSYPHEDHQGGHLGFWPLALRRSCLKEAVDFLATREGVRVFSAPRIPTRNTHGTGCTLSAAIAALLALETAPSLGHGPVNPFA